MDNRKVDVVSEGLRAFELAVELLMDNCPGGKITHWLDKRDKLYLFWGDDAEGEAQKIPFAPLDLAGAIQFGWRWLTTRDDTHRQMAIDHDGSNGRGFRVSCDDWGHCDGYRYAVMRIEAVWAWYGK